MAGVDVLNLGTISVRNLAASKGAAPVLIPSTL